MIAPEKHKQALKAIQAIIVHARFLAYTKADYAKIADILDCGEILPTLLFTADDETKKFGDYLRFMAEKQSDCMHIYDEFIAS